MPDPLELLPENLKQGEASLSVKIETKASQYEEWLTQLEQTDKIPDRRLISNPGHTSVGVSITKNLGNYQSLRISTMVVLPCEPTLKSANDNADICNAIAEEKAISYLERWRDVQI